MATKKLVLEAIPETQAYRTTVHGKPAIVAYHPRNRQSEERATISVTLRSARMDAASALARAEKVFAYVAVEVTVKSKWHSGWLVPVALFKKFKHGELDFSLSSKARAAYAADEHSLTEVHFEIK